jgi:hypothetical protein
VELQDSLRRLNLQDSSKQDLDFYEAFDRIPSAAAEACGFPHAQRASHRKTVAEKSQVATTTRAGV